jgi:phospholipase C
MTVNTIVVVMMENRSFDHLLGHLALSGHPVDGLRNDPMWLDEVASTYKGASYRPFPSTDPYDAIEADPPHGRDSIAIQLGPFVDGKYSMKGFVESYSKAKGATPITPDSRPPVMGYFTGAEAPITDFLARNFAVCDHWHAALPAGTQPNRLMAMSGVTPIEYNKVPLPHHELVYDWLTRNGIRWRVYHEGIPFFAMMLDRVDDILFSDNFRPFAQFYQDVQDEPPDEFPQVVFLEPVYSDAPHIGPCSDDHSPAGIKGGQEFLLEAYRSLTRVPDVWNGSVMIVSYDEHGGFFDHVSPPRIRTEPPPGADYDKAFESLGVRVPALVISPFVKPGTVFSEVMDHTSILKFIAETFGDGAYSTEVDGRPVASVSAVLNDPDGSRDSPVVPSLVPYLAKAPRSAGRVPGTAAETPIQHNFQHALDAIRDHPDRPPGPFDDLLAAFPRSS